MRGPSEVSFLSLQLLTAYPCKLLKLIYLKDSFSVIKWCWPLHRGLARRSAVPSAHLSPGAWCSFITFSPCCVAMALHPPPWSAPGARYNDCSHRRHLCCSWNQRNATSPQKTSQLSGDCEMLSGKLAASPWGILTPGTGMERRPAHRSIFAVHRWNKKVMV